MIIKVILQANFVMTLRLFLVTTRYTFRHTIAHFMQNPLFEAIILSLVWIDIVVTVFYYIVLYCIKWKTRVS
jgi:hypothetical protein